MTGYYLTDRGNAFNEDFVYSSDHFGILIDGASGLAQKKFTKGNTDAQMLSHTLGSKLVELLSDNQVAFGDILNQAILEVNQEIFSPTQDWQSPDLPSCTLSCFRILGETLTVHWLGDSPIMVFTVDGPEMFFDHKIGQNDEKVIEEIGNLIAQGLSFDEAKSVVKPLLSKNRETKNTHEGYWIMDPSGLGIPHLQTRVFPLEKVKGVVICSDGFYRLWDVFHVLTDETDLSKFNQYGKGIKLVDKLRQLELAPESMIDYLRLKIADDASVLYWENNMV